RIKQTNALPISDNYQLPILDELSQRENYSIELSIFNPLPNEDIPYQVLKTASNDSAGVVYATSVHLQQALTQWHMANHFWSVFFALLCFSCIGLFIYQWVALLKGWRALVLQLFILGVGWFIFAFSSVASQWFSSLLTSLTEAEIQSYRKLF